MKNGRIAWGSDVPVSMPEPLTRKSEIDMGGFTFTVRGIAHDFTENEYETFMIPTFSPDYFGLAGDVPV